MSREFEMRPAVLLVVGFLAASGCDRSEQPTTSSPGLQAGPNPGQMVEGTSSSAPAVAEIGEALLEGAARPELRRRLLGPELLGVLDYGGDEEHSRCVSFPGESQAEPAVLARAEVECNASATRCVVRQPGLFDTVYHLRATNDGGRRLIWFHSPGASNVDPPYPEALHRRLCRFHDQLRSGPRVEGVPDLTWDDFDGEWIPSCRPSRADVLEYLEQARTSILECAELICTQAPPPLVAGAVLNDTRVFVAERNGAGLPRLVAFGRGDVIGGREQWPSLAQQIRRARGACSP